MLLLSLALSPEIEAATLAVDNAGCTLVNAIQNANSDTDGGGNGCAAGSGADSITLPANSTILLTAPLGNADTGLPLVTSTIIIEGKGSTIARDQGASTHFRILATVGSGNLTLNNLTLTGGYDDGDGGGLYLTSGSSMTLVDSTVSGNTAQNYGGGIYNTGTLSLLRSTVSGNISLGSGAGIANGSFNNGGTVSLISSTVSGNATSYGGGGGISIDGGSVSLSDSTVTGNLSNSAAGGGGVLLSNGGPLTLVRSIVAGNAAPSRSYSAEIRSITGAIVNNYNLIGYSGVANAEGVTLGATDFTPSQDIAQILDTTLASNGGPTQTHALVAGSPAINAVLANCPAGATDQRGVPRPASSACDVGAFEFSGSYVVNALNNGDDGTCDASNCTLREAINAANASAGVPDFITLPANSTITLANPAQQADTGLPLVTSTITIEGNGSTIARDQRAGTPRFRILATAGSGNLTLKNLSLTGGYNDGLGGGLLVDNGSSMSLIDCTVSGNIAYGGGGIHTAGTLSLLRSTVAGNTTNRSGGAGIRQVEGAISISNSTISGNADYAGAGGGIYMTNSSGNNYPTASLIDSTVTGNFTSGFGGGGGVLLINGRSLTLVRSIVAGNAAPNRSQSAEIRSVNGAIVNNYNLIGFNGVANAEGVTLGATDFTPSQDIAQILNTTLASNGGPTQTHALVAGSPAINAVPLAQCASSDQRGITRPQGVACDVGAFELRLGNLKAIKTASTATARVNDPVSFSLSARNLAGSADSGGTLTDTVPAAFRIDSVTQNNSVCTTSGQTVSCQLPTLAPNGVATVNIATTALSLGTVTNTATVTSGAGIDTDPTDNSDSATVTVALDTTPDTFRFPDKVDVMRGSLVLTDEVTLTGIEFPTPFLVENGRASINGGACTRIDEPVGPDDRLRLCHTASNDFAADTVTTVTVGTFQTTFTSTTEARDITPAVFQFTDVPGTVEPGSLQTSPAITVSGINDSTPFSVIGGKASLNGLPCDPALGLSSGLAGPAATITVCHLAGPFGSVNDTTLTLGADGVLSGVSDTFTSSTRAADTTPDTFRFPNKVDVMRGSLVLSDEVILTGIEFPTPFLVENGAASINGGACVRINEPVAPGDRLRLCHTASASFATDTVTTVTVGTFQTTFTSTTAAAPVVDVTPDAFGFASEALISPNSRRTSKAIVITGYAAPTTIQVSAGSQYSIGCKSNAFTDAPGMISPKQSVCVRHMSSPDLGKTVTTTLTVGGIDGTYSTTTNPPDTRPNNFSFPTTTGVAVNSVNTSSPITVGGINTASPISVSAGSFYSIGNGPFVDTPGTVVNGNSVRVRTTASNRRNISVVATLTIGGVNGLYRVTTAK